MNIKQRKTDSRDMNYKMREPGKYIRNCKGCCGYTAGLLHKTQVGSANRGGQWASRQ